MAKAEAQHYLAFAQNWNFGSNCGYENKCRLVINCVAGYVKVVNRNHNHWKKHMKVMAKVSKLQ